MEDNRFYKFVWRFNGVVIMVALLGIVTFTIYNLLKEIFHTRPTQVIRNVADDPSGQEKWRLGYPQQIEGTSYIYIPLISELEDIKLRSINRKADLGSYSSERYSKPTRNILFVNTEKNTMKWLFPSNNQLITNIQLLPETKYSDKRHVEAIMYQVVQKDTDGDKKLTADDDSILSFSRPDGGRYQESLSATDRLIDAILLENKTIFIMFQTKGIGYSSTLRLSDFTTISKTELPKVPN